MRISSPFFALLVVSAAISAKFVAQEGPVDLAAERKTVEDTISLLERSFAVLDGVQALQESKTFDRIK